MCPLKSFLLGCTHETPETFRPVLLCGDPLPELSSDILPPHQNKSTPREVLGLLLPGAWHLPAGHEYMSLNVCVQLCVCVRMKVQKTRGLHIQCAHRGQEREEVAGGTFPQAQVALIYRQWKLGYTYGINGTGQRQTNAGKVKLQPASDYSKLPAEFGKQWSIGAKF